MISPTTINHSYDGWTRDQLIQRLLTLERSTTTTTARGSPTPSVNAIHSDTAYHPAPVKIFNFSNYPKRKIALRFCYSGWEYAGLAYQGVGQTQLPTVEGVLFNALSKARLIDPEGGMEACGWEKCGRTDKGVSAAGQVISLWVRSAVGRVEIGKENQQGQGVGQTEEDRGEQVVLDGLPGLDEEDFGTLGTSDSTTTTTTRVTLTASESQDVAGVSKARHELDYIAILNRLLPPTIRILAWAPVADAFSARFSCKYRHYKYFFSSDGLDVSRMGDAASRLIGEHDFRNLCKVDAQKQITMFRRNISRADIQAVDDNQEDGMYVFNLVGSAFLYHQVRHIMAILFLVGTGLEKPSLVTKLMNVVDKAEEPREGDLEGTATSLEVVDRRPEYPMADALPLMLWDCGYAEEDIKWRTGTVELGVNNGDGGDALVSTNARRSGSGTETDLYHQLDSIWSRSKIYTALDGHFLQAAERYHEPAYSPLPLAMPGTRINEFAGSFNYPVGGGVVRRVQKYVPVLERNRLATVDVINERWRLGKGSRRAERKAGLGATEEEDAGDE